MGKRALRYFSRTAVGQGRDPERSNRSSAMLLLVLVISAPAAADSFDYCIVCHGAEGNGNVAIRAPKIAGLEPWYVARQLEAFAAGIRGAHEQDHSGQEMRVVGIRLEQQRKIEDAVRFVSSLHPVRPPSTVTGNVERGRELFAACAACHGAKGEGNKQLGAPALAACSDWYLLAQLDKFRRGERGSDERDVYGAQMRAAAAALPDEQAAADVVAYINTLE